MKKLAPVSVTADERVALASAVGAVRCALERFDAANADTGCYAPTVLLSVNALESHWRVSVIGRPPAHGSTLEAALANLAGQSDADMLRARAAAMRDAAAALERDAAALETVTGNPAAVGRAGSAGAAGKREGAGT